MAKFELAIPKTLKLEGGEVNDPNDRGKHTRFGITEFTARASGYAGSMSDLPKETAISIYKKEYWDKVYGDRIDSQSIAETLFDIKVNGGAGFQWLQKALNVLNKQQSLWQDVPIDGLVGPYTVMVLNAATKVDIGKPITMENRIQEILISHRSVYFTDICLNELKNKMTDTQEKFANGWVNRAILDRRDG